MAESVDLIYKALRLVPEFDGNSNVLTRFIKLCDQLVHQYMSDEPGHQLTNLALLNGILNKVVGSAARLINTNGIPDSWEGIRSSLINNFADQRDETSLYNDLALLTQGTATPQEFYEQCQNLFSTIMTYISLHETVATTIESKRTLYKKLTLQSFLRGLRDPLGSRIRCMRPDTIEKALEYVHDEMNTLYLQQRNERAPEKKLQYQHQVSPRFSYGFKPPMQTAPPSAHQFTLPPPRPFNIPGPSRLFVPHTQQPFLRNQPPQYRGPSRTQQMFSAPPPNSGPQNQVFRMPGPRPSGSNLSQPMSGVSHYVAKPFAPRPTHDWSRSGNPPASNYFKTKEVNYNDFADQVQYDYYYDFYNTDSYYPYECSENSHEYVCEQPQAEDTYTIEEVPCTQPSDNEDFPKDSKSDKLK